jgi:hypothetical protein
MEVEEPRSARADRGERPGRPFAMPPGAVATSPVRRVRSVTHGVSLNGTTSKLLLSD